MSSASKRRIGGHFGAALGASTKRQRGDWREEVDGEEEAGDAAAKADGDDDSEEAIINPGTPLPSEDEEEPAAAPEETLPATEPAAEAPAPTGDAPLAEAEATPAEPAPAKDEEMAPADAGGSVPKAVAVTLDVIVGKNNVGQLRILLPLGLDPDVEKRLQACAPPDGGAVDFIASGAFCGFAGHEVPGVKEKEKQKKKEADAEKGAAPEMAAGLLPVEAAEETPADPAPANGFLSAGLHSCVGLLTAPRTGSGLALTLAAQPALDQTHRVLGPVLAGRRCFRRLEAVAPLSFEAIPRVPVFLQLPKPEEDLPGASQVTLRVEPYPQSAAEPFAEDPEKDGAALSPEEIIDLADVELSGRDVEVAELKLATFSRERQQGVDRVEEALDSMLRRLDGLQELDETLSGQRVWVQEGSNRLLRVLKKLH